MVRNLTSCLTDFDPVTNGEGACRGAKDGSGKTKDQFFCRNDNCYGYGSQRERKRAELRRPYKDEACEKQKEKDVPAGGDQAPLIVGCKLRTRTDRSNCDLSCDPQQQKQQDRGDQVELKEKGRIETQLGGFQREVQRSNAKRI
ncbi:MAG: hypothetical protein VYD57_13990 [Pseudomonadota bacterium]|nr:hypothetical protein [Pseudomonadota bacterium]